MADHHDSRRGRQPIVIGHLIDSGDIEMIST